MYVFDNKFTGETFKKNIELPLAKEYLRVLNEDAEKYKGTPIKSLEFSEFNKYFVTGNRKDYEEKYFEHRKRLDTFGIRAWLWKEKEDIAELENILWAICDEYAWALPPHCQNASTDGKTRWVDLMAAETGLQISQIISVCKDLINPVVKERCINEVMRRVIGPFERHTSKIAWEFSGGNWSAVCGGAVGAAAVYLIEDEQRLKKITDRAAASCMRFIDTCEDDGACLEGIGYWNYAMRYYVIFADILKTRTGEDILKGSEKREKVCNFPTVCCLGNGNMLRFSDAGQKVGIIFGTICKLYEIFGIEVPSSEYFSKAPNMNSIEWFNPKILHDNDGEKSTFFPEGQWAVEKNGKTVLAIKGGYNDEPHNHNDVGSYMFIKNGCRLADELGAPEYTRDFFEEKRYAHVNASSIGHSVPIVNGQPQLYGKKYAADRFDKTKDGVEISFAGAYDQSVTCIENLVRSTKVKDDKLTVKDIFEFSKNGNQVKERIITHLEAKKVSDNAVELYENGELKGVIEFKTNGRLTVSEDQYYAHGVNKVVVKFYEIDLFVNTPDNKFEIEYSIK